jgi:hypothetical protein
MSLVSELVDALKDVTPAKVEELKSVVANIVNDLNEVNKDIETVLSVVPPSVLHLPPEIAQYQSELTAVLAIVNEALSAL